MAGGFTMPRSLEELRREIDRVNLDILKLLNERTNLVKEISDLKDKIGLTYFDPVREAEMLEGIFRQNQGPLPNELLKEIFTTIFSSALQYMGIKKEKKLLIAAGQKSGFMSLPEMFGLAPDEPMLIAGPCAVEKVDYLESIASFLNLSGLGFYVEEHSNP